MNRYFAIAIVAVLAGCAPVGVDLPPPPPPAPVPVPVVLIPVAPIPPLPVAMRRGPVHVAVHHPVVIHQVVTTRHWVRRVHHPVAVNLWAAACGSDAHPCNQQHTVVPTE
jgi:hypothetical protein